MFSINLHLREHVKERISVSINDRRNIRNAVVHVGPHHLNLLVKILSGVDILNLRIHSIPHEICLTLDKLLIEDVGACDEVAWLQNADIHSK